MLIIAVHAAVFAAVPVYAAFGTPVFPLAGAPAVVLPLGFAMFALQLRHSLAASREERPRLWPLTLLALVVLAYAPLPWFGWEWALMTLYVTPSLSMLLPRGLEASRSWGSWP